MTRGHRIGLAIAALGPFIFGFLSTDPALFLAFGLLFYLSHIVLRPYDFPRGIECIQNTGFLLLIGRAGVSIAQAGLPLLAGMVLAKLTGYPLRAIDIPGYPELSQPGIDLSPETLLAITLAVSIAGIGLARAIRRNVDLFGSRTGLWGVGERIDTVMTRRFGRASAMFNPQASRPGSAASMVVIRPWALRPLPEDKSSAAMQALVARAPTGGHQKRLAHVLALAARRGNPDAAIALQEFLKQPGTEALRNVPEFSIYC
jgi:hypothetical protein